jgi:predicted phosphohydrolase
VRIVAVADTHTFEADLGSIPDGDVFVHAGDIIRGGELSELEGPAQWIRDLPHRHKIVIAGNHDWCFLRERDKALALLGEGVTYLEDSAHEIEGVNFWGAPWQPEYNDWAFNLPRGSALADKWKLIPASCDVLITHGPPAGFGDRGGMAVRAGCADLLSATERVAPLLHMFGHIHQDGGLFPNGPTTHANVTTWECERGPTVLDIDIAAGTVTPVLVPLRDPMHPDS